MDDAQQSALVVLLAVGVSQTPANSRNDEDRQVGGHVLFGFDVPVKELFQVPTGDELHGHEILFAHLAQMISLHDVGVNQVGHQFGFSDEVVSEFFDGGVFLTDEFDRDDFAKASDSTLHRFVNHPHSTFGNLTR